MRICTCPQALSSVAALATFNDALTEIYAKFTADISGL